MMVSAQQWLDENYPVSQRKNLRELDISNKNLVGSLDLNQYIAPALEQEQQETERRSPTKAKKK